MTLNARLILELIEEGHSIDEIQSILKLNNRQFSDALKYLKDAGYNFQRQIFSDGRIIIKPNKTLNFNEHNKRTRIIVKDRILKAIFISPRGCVGIFFLFY